MGKEEFLLFALIRKKSSWAAILTMAGGAALLADGKCYHGASPFIEAAVYF
jgi:hypothetical protein